MGLCDINKGPEIPQEEWICQRCQTRIRRESGSQALPNNIIFIWCNACGWSDRFPEDVQWSDQGYGHSLTPRPLARLCDPPDREQPFPNYTSATTGPDTE